MYLKHKIKFLFIIFLTITFSACEKEKQGFFQGYTEGEFVYLSCSIGGILENLAVIKGQTVKKGDFLFSLEQTFEKAGLYDAQSPLQQAEDRLADLEKGLRPSEIAAIESRLKQAKISLQLAESEYKRRAELFKKQTISQEEQDKAKTAYEFELQKVKITEAELQTAKAGTRPDQISAAKAAAESAKAKTEQAKWNLEQKTKNSPADGLVFDTFYQQGELVPAGRPVICLLPPENIKIRFFVPETVVSQIKIGQKISVFFDGGGIPVLGKISFISPQSEYTPPIIYSSQSRAKLVFMIESVPDSKSVMRLHPGQPVDVKLTEN